MSFSIIRVGSYVIVDGSCPGYTPGVFGISTIEDILVASSGTAVSTLSIGLFSITFTDTFPLILVNDVFNSIGFSVSVILAVRILLIEFSTDVILADSLCLN